MQQNINFTFEKYQSSTELSSDDQLLLAEAKEAIKLAYAPYSNFFVGAAARLTNGEIVKGSNQENASYGATICAERVLLASISSLYSGETINTIAISTFHEGGAHSKPVSPCGICRQTLIEHERIAKHPLRIIMSGQNGEIWVVDSITNLLPLAFTNADME